MDKTNTDLNADIGMDAINFNTIFAAAKSAGVKHYIIKHESNYNLDFLGSVQAGFKYIKN